MFQSPPTRVTFLKWMTVDKHLILEVKVWQLAQLAAQMDRATQLPCLAIKAISSSVNLPRQSTPLTRQSFLIPSLV